MNMFSTRPFFSPHHYLRHAHIEAKSHPNELKTQVFDRIQDVPEDDWNRLAAGRSCTFSHEFWRTLAQARLNDFKYRYVIFREDNGNAVGLTSFYSITTDVAIFAPKWLRSLLNVVRRAFPNFLKVRMLECGTPVTLNSPPIVTVENRHIPAVVEALDQLLANVARAERIFLIVIRDFEPEALYLEPEFQKYGYRWIDNLPNTYLDIQWDTPEKYLAALKSYYRSKLMKHLRRNRESNVRHELTENFSHLADRLCHQWNVVHAQADEFQREMLTPDFYRALRQEMGSRAKVLLFFRNDAPAGHALLLHDGDLLRWLYFGRERPGNDSLYFYVIYKVIETAIQLGVRKVEMGLTTYSIKRDLGAQRVLSKMAIRTTLPLINPLIGLGYSMLNRPPKIDNKNVFIRALPQPDHRTPAMRRRKNR